MGADVLADVAAVDAPRQFKAFGELAAVFDSQIGIATASVESPVATESMAGTCTDAGAALRTGFVEPRRVRCNAAGPKYFGKENF